MRAGVRAEPVGRVLGGDPALQRRAAQLDLVLARPRSARVSPAAIRSCAWTRSTSVTSSVTVCSTWIRGFISMNTCRPALAVSTQELDRAGVDVADLPGERHRVGTGPSAQRRGQVRSRARSRRPSGAGAGPSSPARTGARRRRRRRPGSAPRCAGVARRPARGTPSGRRTRPRPRASPPRRASRSSAGSLDPAHPPPAAAGDGLDEHAGSRSRPRPPRARRGRRTAPRSAAPGAPAARAACTARDLVPGQLAAPRRRPDEGDAGLPHALARSGFSDRKP